MITEELIFNEEFCVIGKYVNVDMQFDVQNFICFGRRLLLI